MWVWLGVPVGRGGGGVVGGDAWRLEVWIGLSTQTDQSFCSLVTGVLGVGELRAVGCF